MSKAFDVQKIRADFPILGRKVHGKALVYLDSAATTQKPRGVIDAIAHYYSNSNANVRRGAYQLSAEATELYEGARGKIARFIGTDNTREVIYTRGTTEAVNLVMRSWGEANVRAGDDIVVTRMEHHSNFVPWQALARRTGANFKIIELTADGRLDLRSVEQALSGRPKLLAVTHMSNVLGTINPVAEIAQMAKSAGATVLVDGAQGAAHLPVRVHELGPIDFYAFSAHKMCGPTGVGVLWGRESVLESMDPFLYGGDMISFVEDERSSWNELPWKFEAGTPNVSGVVGFAAAIDYLQSLGMDAVRAYEKEIGAYALEKLSSAEGVRVIGPTEMRDRGSVVSFEVKDVHPHDLATFLDVQGIAVRAGHHCAQPLMNWLRVPATARASFYFYNTKAEVDQLAAALVEAQRYFA